MYTDCLHSAVNFDACSMSRGIRRTDLIVVDAWD